MIVLRKFVLAATSVAAAAMLLPPIVLAKDPQSPPGQGDDANGPGAKQKPGNKQGSQGGAPAKKGAGAGAEGAGGAGGPPQGRGFGRRTGDQGGGGAGRAQGGEGRGQGAQGGAARKDLSIGGPAKVIEKPVVKAPTKPSTIESDSGASVGPKVLNKTGQNKDAGSAVDPAANAKRNRRHGGDEAGASGNGETGRGARDPNAHGMSKGTSENPNHDGGAGKAEGTGKSGGPGKAAGTGGDEPVKHGNSGAGNGGGGGRHEAQDGAPPSKSVIGKPVTGKPTDPTGNGKALPGGPVGEHAGRKPDGGGATATGGGPERMEQIKKGRTETKVDGGKDVIIKEQDNRTIIKQNNKIVIQHDETERIRKVAPNARFERGKGGDTIAVIDRPNGVKIYSESDANGQLIRRYRRDASGRDTVIIDNRRRGWNKKRRGIGKDIAIGAGIGVGIVAGAAILNSIVDVPPPRVRIPREKYVVDYDNASDDDVYEALSAPPVEDFRERYTLDQIRATPRLRERMRRVDLDDINFETGSWQVDPSQYRKLDRIARAMSRVIAANPNEVFMIEGYTDAVGSREDNLSLSDRRAESVAEVLSEQFQVPFENLTTQGYGEDYLKVETDGPERLNRRVAVRRITPLLTSGGPPPPRAGGPQDDGPDEGPPDGQDDGGPREDYRPYNGPPDRN